MLGFAVDVKIAFVKRALRFEGGLLNRLNSGLLL